MAEGGPRPVASSVLEGAVSEILVACGVDVGSSRLVAEDLVAADMEGVASHGVMLLPMYVARLQARSITTYSDGLIVSDRDAAVIIDARDALGQLTSRQAVGLAIERARRFGIAAVAVRNAAHIGMAGRYVDMMAKAGCVGIVLSNTRPLMPAPGGSVPVTGNNPIAIAVPSASPFVPEVDMALSAVAMGRIRNAAAAGLAIPEGWATDAQGNATTDPNAAISGMLLPAAGPKGFGLAFLIDLLCGGLSDGAIGAEVSPLFGDPAVPYRCANTFIAIDVDHFVPEDRFSRRSAEALARVSASPTVVGVDQVFAPGERGYAARQKAGNLCHLSAVSFEKLIQTGRSLNVDMTSLQ